MFAIYLCLLYTVW